MGTPREATLGRCVMRRLLLAIGAVTGAFALASTPAAAQQTLPGIVLSETIRAAPGSIHLAATVPVDPAQVGSSCDVSVVGENNQSVHPNSDVFIASANEVVARDVERMAGNVVTPAGVLLLGDTITVRVQLGSDGVFSGGLLTVEFACTPPTPPTTTPTSPTTVAPPVTPAGAETPAGATGAGQPGAAAGGTLPRTGSSTNVGLIAAGIACVATGAGLVLTRRARKDAHARA
jgi:LPXTG-motif cell wall-anchored protein